MRKASLIMFGSGVICFLIGGAGLDGSGAVACGVLAAASFAVAVAGYILWEISERGEKKTMKEGIVAEHVNFQGEPGYMVSQFVGEEKVAEQFVSESGYIEFCKAAGIKPELID